MVSDWDTALTGENAFAGAVDRAYIHAAANGVTDAGVGGSGAGVIEVYDISFNPLHLDFEIVSGNPGGGVFMDHTTVGEGFTPDWDNKIEGEGAFGGVKDGAVLNGTMSAQAIQGAGYAELDVDDVNVSSGSWYAGLMFAAPMLEGAVVLENPGFDDGESLDPWSTWGNAYAQIGLNGTYDFTPLSGDRALKLYGMFQGSYNTSGAYQDLPAEAGQTWELHGYALHVAGDGITGSQNWVEMKIEFRDAGNNIVGSNGLMILDGTSATDTWMDPTPIQATAPAGTVIARALFAFHQPDGSAGGAGMVDNATFEVVSGPTSAVDLSAITLTADIKGIVDAAGETLGDYQLRIEDGDGDKLVFTGTTDGTWQSVGGFLSDAVEMTSNGVVTPGVFDTDDPGYTVVITLDNDTTLTWGTGGTLQVDNIILSGTEPMDSAWYGGLHWDGLTLPEDSLEDMMLTADVLGDVVDGAYELRVEGFIFNSNGVDESFEEVVGNDGQQVIVNYDMTTSGVYTGWSNNWDTGILGEEAFGGFAAGSVLCSENECPGTPDVGITAKGLLTGGNPGSCAQIKSKGLWQLAPGGDWWGGMTWPNQALASTDLSQVTLVADVKGIADALFAETLGTIELRIEDEQGDRLYVQTTATSSWQQIGGTLDTFTEAGRAGGGGDGTFNLDALNYTVTIAFADPYTTWGWGGAIQVDNIYLTPADVAVELGRITYEGVADGTFQSVGGYLSEGVSTFVEDLDEDFETGAGETLQLWPASWYEPSYDSGIENGACFAGTWGSGQLGAVTYDVCADCGFDGSKATRMVVENPAPGGGGWWAGVAMENQRLMIEDLSLITLTAKIKAEPVAGGNYGIVYVKLEDSNMDAMEFQTVPDGTWQTIGGTLDTANMVASGDTSQGSDGIFDIHSPWFKVVIGTWGPGASSEWTSSHTVIMDDIQLTRPGYGFDDAESFTVALAFADEMNTWPDGGSLTLDNLMLGAAAATSCDGDADIDLVDFAQFQSCFGGNGTGDCACADTDGDGDVDLADYAVFAGAMTGPQ